MAKIEKAGARNRAPAFSASQAVAFFVLETWQQFAHTAPDIADNSVAMMTAHAMPQVSVKRLLTG